MHQKDLEQEARALSTQSARYAKQTAQWLALVEQFESSLKVKKKRRFSEKFETFCFAHNADDGSTFDPSLVGTGRCSKLGPGH